MTSAPPDASGAGDQPWVVPDPPLPPQEPPTVRTVEDAFLTRFSQGPIPNYERRKLRFIQGAVYDADGVLVPASQKLGGVGTNRHLAADPHRISLPKRPKTLTGRWLYGGHWNQHFGHFMVETITTLWPQRRDFDGVVFHQYFGWQSSPAEWTTFFLDELGFGSVPIKVVSKHHGLAVEELTVPDRAVVAQAYAHPEARAVWDQVASRSRRRTHGGKLYLSRTAFHEGLRQEGRDSIKRVRSDPARDRELDAIFGAAGFQVVAPETLSIERQVALVANVDVIAGGSGSALHLAAFARRGTRVLELGDDRDPHESLAMQRLIAAVSDQPLLFVPRSADRDDVRRVVERHGLADDGGRRPSWRRS